MKKLELTNYEETPIIHYIPTHDLHGFKKVVSHTEVTFKITEQVAEELRMRIGSSYKLNDITLQYYVVEEMVWSELDLAYIVTMKGVLRDEYKLLHEEQTK